MEPLCAGDWREYGADASCTARRRGRGKSRAGGVQPRCPARNHLRFALHLVFQRMRIRMCKKRTCSTCPLSFWSPLCGEGAPRASGNACCCRRASTNQRSCPRGRRLRAAGQTAQAKWIAARLKTLSNHGSAGPIQIAGFVVGFGVRALAPGCAAPPVRAAHGKSALRGL